MSPGRVAPRFEDLTETTGVPLSPEGAAMMYTRYVVGSRLGEHKRVLEIGCGAGQGLGLVGSRARMVVGGDYSSALLRTGRRHYGSRFPLVRLSADRLPFADGSFDTVLFFEASYYVPDMERGFAELHRVLASGGAALLVNANPERPDFIRSPHSTHYHSADQFRTAMERQGFAVTVEGAFPVEPEAAGVAQNVTAAVFRLARRVLESLHLVPRTLRGRARLKRLLYGKLPTVPPELSEGFGPEEPTLAVGPGSVTGYKVVYVQATKRA